jgi:hypothetical protein
MKLISLCLLSSMLWVSCSAAETLAQHLDKATPTLAPIIDWNEGVTGFRAGKFKHGAILYIGRRTNTFIRKVQAGKINTKGQTIIVLSAEKEVLNPFTNKMVYGLDVIRLYAGLISSNPAGSLFFLDANMVPRAMHNVHHLMHRNKPERINLLIDYATHTMDGQLVSNKMSLDEFGSIVGGEKARHILMEMVLEMKGGELSDPRLLVMKHFSKQIKKDACVLAFNDKKEQIDPAQTEGRFFIVTADPNGPAFMALMIDMAVKLRTTSATGQIVQAPMTVIGPADADYNTLELMGIKFERANATIKNIKKGPCPRIIMSGNTGKGGTIVEVYGYVQGDILGTLVGLQVPDRSPLAPDLPIGELDWDPNP